MGDGHGSATSQDVRQHEAEMTSTLPDTITAITVNLLDSQGDSTLYSPPTKPLKCYGWIALPTSHSRILTETMDWRRVQSSRLGHANDSECNCNLLNKNEQMKESSEDNH